MRLRLYIIGILAVFAAGCSSCKLPAKHKNPQALCNGVACNSDETCEEGKCVADAAANKNPCNFTSQQGVCRDGKSCVRGVCSSSGDMPAACSVGVNGACPNLNEAC